MSVKKEEIGANTELAQELRQNIFSKRKNIQEAYDYAGSLIESMNSSDRIAALTALHVVLNTVADEIERRDLKEM